MDVSAGFGGVLAIKDMAARDCVTKAADYATKVLKKFLLPRIEDIIDKEEKVAQSDLADQTEDAIKEPAKLGVQTVRTRREKEREICRQGSTAELLGLELTRILFLVFFFFLL